MDNTLRNRAALAVALLLAAGPFARADLLVTRSVYSGNAGTVTVGQTLPGGGIAIANGAYPFVFNNDIPDASFGVTSPIFVDHLTNSGTPLSTLAVPTSVVTSFSSKSEMAINLSANGQAATFMAYVASPNTLDVSNSNTPNHFDPTNPVANTFQRAVVQVNSNGTVQITPVNAYSGNNGRAVVLAGNGLYYMVGNAGNGSGTEPTNIVNNTGVQSTTPGGNAETNVVGARQGTPGSKNGFQFGYSVTQNGLSADKSGKDDNFRGLTLFNNTLYVSKGSGSNGVNSVYQVNNPLNPGKLPTTPAEMAAATITILPGFPTLAANSASGVSHPFGLFFANANTLYVADEGDGSLANANSGQGFGGLQKWTFDGTKWNLVYTLTNGLNLGVPYAVPGYPTGINPATGLPWAPETDGLRNLTGLVNGDGTVTLFATTSTVSGSGDPGADPNEVVSITDVLSATGLTALTGESFTVIDGPVAGQVFRGVAEVPSDFLVPEPSTLALFGLAGAALGAWRWRRRRTA